jgi:hypothetical protein
MSAKEQLERIAKRRKRIAQQVSDAPNHWKICVGRQSLNVVENVFCPFCHSYGFEFDRKQIIAMARTLAWPWVRGPSAPNNDGNMHSTPGLFLI